MPSFEKGDVVVLKSGGPRMTVVGVGDYSGGFSTGPEDGVQCTWFELVKGVQKVQDHVFDATALTKYEPPASTVRLQRS